MLAPPNRNASLPSSPTDRFKVRTRAARIPAALAIMIATAFLGSCGRRTTGAANASSPVCAEISVVKVTRKNLQRHLTVSSELVPFEQIDLFAKESGFIRTLSVDYGSHVRKGQVLAVLEIPELQMQLEEDDAEIGDATDQVARFEKELDRVKAQQNVLHLEYSRLEGVVTSKPGLVAQQEVDNAHGKDLASEAEVGAASSALRSARNQLMRAQAKRRRDQA